MAFQTGHARTLLQLSSAAEWGLRSYLRLPGVYRAADDNSWGCCGTLWQAAASRPSLRGPGGVQATIRSLTAGGGWGGAGGGAAAVPDHLAEALQTRIRPSLGGDDGGVLLHVRSRTRPHLAGRACAGRLPRMPCRNCSACRVPPTAMLHTAQQKRHSLQSVRLAHRTRGALCVQDTPAGPRAVDCMRRHLHSCVDFCWWHRGSVCG